MKHLLKITLLFLLTHQTFGQNDKWIRGFGFAAFSEVFSNPYYTKNDSKGKPTDIYKSDIGYAYFSASFVNQIKLYKIDNNKVIGIHTSPTIRLAYSNNFASITMPTFITYNFGLMSTVDTDKDKGFVGGLGIIPQTYGFNPFRVFTQAGLYLGYRYWKKEKVKEISLQVGYMKHKDLELYDYDSNNNIYVPNHEYDGKNNSFSVKLSFVKYFNY
jgi:hypothetical protein